MKKKEVLSLVSNPTRLAIIRRLEAAGKAAYSDIMDSVDYIQPLNSTGNLNYHLNFLLKTQIIEKDGAVYRLTETGGLVLDFVKDTEDRWQELQRSLSGETMNLVSCAEQFEDETGIKMEREAIDFHGHNMIMDEDRIIGILTLDEDTAMFTTYSLLNPEGFSLSKNEYSDSNGVKKIVTLLHHTDLKYELSPKWFGVVQDFLERNYGQALVYAELKAPSPFLLRAAVLGNKGTDISFVVAPSVIDKKMRKVTASKK